MANKAKKQIVVAVSGGFDPLHVGHIRMMREAKKLGHKLVVILNNDNWIQTKKGCVFMNQKERKELIESIGCVDEVVLTSHTKVTKDMSVCGTLKKVKPDVFANGGDRKFDNIPEVPVCEKLGCKMVFNIGKGGKVQSSSWLLTDYLTKKNGK
jgi:D-beta-D-heptose 7-phosphate kinase/D-beta-D-heptose 1-phosphate adenosyltransferase